MNPWHFGLGFVLAMLLGRLLMGCAAPITRPGTRGCAEGDVVALQEKDGPARCVCINGEYQGPPSCDVLNEEA